MLAGLGDGVKHHEQFAHGGDQSDLLVLSGKSKCA